MATRTVERIKVFICCACDGKQVIFHTAPTDRASRNVLCAVSDNDVDNDPHILISGYYQEPGKKTKNLHVIAVNGVNGAEAEMESSVVRNIS